jgi:acetyl/propionyl-CoA carboxylase alpha subunit
MIETLRETVIFGVRTNIPYLIEILSHSEFVEGKMTTRFIETYFANGLVEPELPAEIKALAEQMKTGGLMQAGLQASLTSANLQSENSLGPWLVNKK